MGGMHAHVPKKYGPPATASSESTVLRILSIAEAASVIKVGKIRYNKISQDLMRAQLSRKYERRVK